MSNSQTTSEIIRNCHLDFTNVLVEPDSGCPLDWNFNLSANTFISFAKTDLDGGDTRGYVNAVTNTKRAIDCQIEKIFKCFGYDSANFPKHLHEFALHFCTNSFSTVLTMKLRVVVAFGLAPGRLVTKTRAIRNKLEHEYIAPTLEMAQDAIEIAELFVAATDRKLIDRWEFEMYNVKSATDDSSVGIRIAQQTLDRSRDCNLLVTLHSLRNGAKVKPVVSIVTPEDPEHAPLMRMTISCSFSQGLQGIHVEEVRKSLIYLLKLAGHPIPASRVAVSIV